MFPQVYLVKDKLFAFHLPNPDLKGVKQVRFDFAITEYSVLPFDKTHELDVTLASKLGKILSQKPAKTRGLQLKLANHSPRWITTNICSDIFRDLLLSLGDQMVLRLEIHHAQVEVPSADRDSAGLFIAGLNLIQENDRAYFAGYCTFPPRWAEYWNKSMKYKFSMQASLIICGKLLLSSAGPGELEMMTMATGTHGLDQETRHSIPKKLLENKIDTDTRIITAEGTYVECHKLFLIVHSAVLRCMLTGSFKEGVTHQIVMDDMSENGVNAFLAYLYYWNLDAPLAEPKVALELLRVAHKYDITSLEKAARRILIGKPVEWFDVSTVIQLFFFSKNLETYSQLKVKALCMLKMKKAEVICSVDYKQLFENDDSREAAMELCNAIINM